MEKHTEPKEDCTCIHHGKWDVFEKCVLKLREITGKRNLQIRIDRTDAEKEAEEYAKKLKCVMSGEQNCLLIQQLHALRRKRNTESTLRQVHLLLHGPDKHWMKEKLEGIISEYLNRHQRKSAQKQRKSAQIRDSQLLESHEETPLVREETKESGRLQYHTGNQQLAE